MRRFLISFSLVLLYQLAMLAPQIAHAGPMLQQLYKCKPGAKVCHITNSTGGRASWIRMAAGEAEREGVQLRIGGFCGSGCESELVRSSAACMERSAHFIRHSGRLMLEKNIIDGLGVVSGDETPVSARAMAAAGYAKFCP